jgi:hypothetical protein
MGDKIMFMTKTIMGVALAAVLCSQVLADEAASFARYWAGILAVEDRCDDYYSLTDAIVGSDLKASEYKRTADMVDELRLVMAETLADLSCQRAAEEVAELGGMPFVKVWERR